MKTHKKAEDMLTSEKQDSSGLGDTILIKSDPFVPILAALGWNHPTFQSQDFSNNIHSYQAVA